MKTVIQTPTFNWWCNDDTIEITREERSSLIIDALNRMAEMVADGFSQGELCSYTTRTGNGEDVDMDFKGWWNANGINYNI